VIAALLSALLVASPHGWTLQHARNVLAGRNYAITDTTQPDQPRYELRFAPLSLRRGFVYEGTAYDTLTNDSIRVHFTFKAPGRVVGFRGPPADTTQPAFPIRAAFYYAWYPEAWWRDPVFPYSRFHPSLDYYSAADARVVRDHTDALRYAHLRAGIYSWWGADGYPPTDLRFWRYLAAARTTPLRWAVYYEREGYADPSVERIHADLEYIRDAYAAKPAYLKVDRRFVVYVYGDANDGCDMAARWRAANTVGAYLVLKAFEGFRSCAAQPAAWHQYSAALSEYDLAPDSFMIAPGFEERSEQEPRLSRDLARWRADVDAMLASNARWQLVLSFNEWPEGTSVESAREWATPSGYGAYLDALHERVP
jgi:glycosyl hydrolase family 99